MAIEKMNKNLIEKINILGPWVHGFFDLGDGIIIKDSDELQRKRLLVVSGYFPLPAPGGPKRIIFT